MSCDRDRPCRLVIVGNQKDKNSLRRTKVAFFLQLLPVRSKKIIYGYVFVGIFREPKLDYVVLNFSLSM